MKSVRLVTGLIILALLLALVPASMAQDGMFGLTGEDLAALAAANGASAGAASAAYDFVLTLNADAGSQGAVSMNLNGSGNYDTTSGGFSLVVSGTVVADGQETPADLQVLVVDETVYIQTSALGPQWLSISPEELEVFGESFAEQLPVDPTSLAGGDAAASEGLMEALNNLATLNPEDYISATRDGNHFTFNADVAGLLGSEQFVQFIVAAAESNPEAAAGMDTAELSTQLGQVSTALQGSTFQLEQFLTDDALMISRTVLSSSFTIDPASLGEEGDAVAFDFVFDINLSGYNEAFTFTAPADAMPLSQMMGGM